MFQMHGVPETCMHLRERLENLRVGKTANKLTSLFCGPLENEE